jgi:subtilase family serine protease
VETAHIAAPAAKIVYVAADCDPTTTYTMQDLLDADARVVDQHLADVVTGSWGLLESEFSPADIAAWDLTLQQGALEGIGFDFSTGDGGADITAPYQPDAGVQFPATDPWAVAVGGTSLAIGRSGTAVADYAWGDNGTQVDPAGTGYTSPPPGDFLQGSGGGVSAVITEPGYQKPVVPAALATAGGTAPARRVIPDIAANAGNLWWIGYTGAVTPGVYGQVNQGATSGAAPLFAGLEADAIQAAGHPLGFLGPALYRLDGSSAIHDVPPVNPADPPMVIGAQSVFGDGTDYLTTLGEDQAPLKATTGYDDVTGLGTPASSFVTAFSRF